VIGLTMIQKTEEPQINADKTEEPQINAEDADQKKH